MNEKIIKMEIDKRLYDKFAIVAEKEQRTVNGEITHIIISTIKDFEDIHGEIEIIYVE